MISAIGNSLSENLSAFRNEESGIGPITQIDSIHCGHLPVGEVKLLNEELANGKSLTPYLTRTALLGIQAAREAVSNSGIQNFATWRTGLISATTVGGMDRSENFFRDFFGEASKGRLRDVFDHECGRSTERIADALGIKGFVSTINTACSSSVNAIMFGARLIKQGMLDIVVAGGADALTKFTINGFNSLMILDKEPCRPFDAGRNGLNLGEGAGYVVLISEKVMRSENLETDVFVSGFANTNDAFHQTASSPEGRGSYAAMIQALEMSGLERSQIDYINLHGTGTANNDQSEGTAITRVFGDAIPKVSSTKAFTGHTLGACGGIEAAYSVMAIQKGVIYPNLRFSKPMTDLQIIPETKFLQGLKINHVMSNSFGFGGNCSSIIFSKN